MTAAVDNQSATLSLRQRLGRAGGRLRPGIGGFWTWWTQALASWLSPRLRTLLGLAHERVLLQLADGELQLALERGDGRQEIALLPWSAQEAGRGDEVLAALLAPRVADMPRWLLLPATAGLRRRLAFPAAAAERLRDVVAFEIDRQTPFAVADVHYDARVVSRGGDQIEAELVAVPRAT
ncbi:MAG: general secretion pathway protein GspL, partial [Luteimonas sp.]|nr:general secretion pathway protein GspL [Luteimonas sp.]